MSTSPKAPMPFSARVQGAFTQLSEKAVLLNFASDELTRLVAKIDQALRKLNLGVSVWVQVSTWRGDDDSYSSEMLGYVKLEGKWCVALKTVSGNYAHPDDETGDATTFAEAPRDLRIRAVRHLPNLLEALAKLVDATTQEILDELETAAEIVDGLQVAASGGGQ